MAYQKPQAIIHQQFEEIPTITEDELRAVIVGPSAILHRYADADEKTDTFLGVYNPDSDVTYSYPSRSAGGIVDKSYSKLYVDNALLSYFNSTKATTDDSTSVKLVKSGTSAIQVYATVTGDGTTASPYVVTTSKDAATEGSAEKPIYVLKYKRDAANNLPLYDNSGNGTTDPFDSAVDKYDSSDASTFKHLFEVATGTEGPLYVSAEDDTTSTTDSTKAKKYTGTSGGNYAYIQATDEPTPKYTFYSDYDVENSVMSDTFNFQKSLTARSGELGIRDVKVGDYAVIWGSAPSSGLCVEYGPQLSRIIGFTTVDTATSFGTTTIDQPVAATAITNTWAEYLTNSTGTSTGTFTYASHNSSTTAPLINSTKLGFITTTRSGSTTVKTLGGVVTVTVSDVITSGNCAGTIYARVTCPAAGIDKTIQLVEGNVSILPEYKEAYCNVILSFTAAQLYAIREKFNDGTILSWTYSFADTYTQLTASNVVVTEDSTTGYTGANDTYILKTTTGGTFADGKIKATVTTSLGVENQEISLSGITSSSGIALGSQGLNIKLNVSSTITGLPAGITILIPVVAPTANRVNGIKLADNVISDLRPTSSGTAARKYINLRLLACEDIELPATSTYDGSTIYTQEDSQLIIKSNASTVSTEFLNTDGTFIPLYVFGLTGTEFATYSKMFFNYREWSPVHSSSCSLCASVSELDNIIGPLDVDNPLKWGVYKALTNSNGASVGYIAIKDPDDLDDWQDAMDLLEGRTDVYTIAPLTTDLSVQNLILTLVNNESSAEACRWKTALFSMTLPEEVMRIGQSTSTQVETSTDGEVVTCKIVANPNLSGTHYNKFICTSGNSKFLDYGVVSGDELRLMNGTAIYKTFTVDEVYSNGTLTTLEESETSEDEVTIEIWHTYTRDEEVELICERAQSSASRRIGLVWPDIVAEGTVEMPGYFLCAGLAGLKSGVEPQQGLTRRTIQGFDSFSRSKPRYTESQLDKMAASGVWVCVEDSDGTPQSRHALNTDTTNSFYSEEMMTRNFDSVSKYMYQVIDAYIGTSNVTQETLLSIYYNLKAACDHLIGNGQMIDYTTITVKQHDLLLDRIVAYLNVGLPFAVNNVDLYITAEAYELNAVTLESEAE